MKVRKRNVIITFVMSLIIGMMSLHMDRLVIPTYASGSDITLPEVKGIKGDVNGDGSVTLIDAQFALRAALGIITLSEEAFWAADLNDVDKVTLSNAQIILRAALGITSNDEKTTSKPEEPQDDDIVFEVITDKDAYQLGEDIQVTVRATNMSDKTINLYAYNYSREECLQISLKSEDGTVGFQDSSYESPAPPMLYFGTLEPGEMIEIERIIYTSMPYAFDSDKGLPDTLPSGVYHMAVTLSYNETPSDREPKMNWYEYTCPVGVFPVIDEDEEKKETDLSELYIAALSSYGIYGSEYLAFDLNNLPYANDADKDAIIEYFKKNDFEVKRASLIDLWKEQGIVDETYDGSYYPSWWSLRGLLLRIDNVRVTENEIIIEGSSVKGWLAAQGYSSVFQKQGKKWVLISTKETWVS